MTRAKVIFFGGPLVRLLVVLACLVFVPPQAGWWTASLLALAFAQHFARHADQLTLTYQIIRQLSDYVKLHKQLAQRVKSLEGSACE